MIKNNSNNNNNNINDNKNDDDINNNNKSYCNIDINYFSMYWKLHLNISPVAMLESMLKHHVAR